MSAPSSHSARWWSATELPGTGSATPTQETVTACGGRVASVEAVALPPNGLRYSICEMFALWDSVPEESPHIPPTEKHCLATFSLKEFWAKAGVDGGDALSGPRRPIPCGRWPVACSSTLLCTFSPPNRRHQVVCRIKTCWEHCRPGLHRGGAATVWPVRHSPAALLTDMLQLAELAPRWKTGCLPTLHCLAVPRETGLGWLDPKSPSGWDSRSRQSPTKLLGERAGSAWDGCHHHHSVEHCVGGTLGGTLGGTCAAPSVDMAPPASLALSRFVDSSGLPVSPASPGRRCMASLSGPGLSGWPLTCLT